MAAALKARYNFFFFLSERVDAACHRKGGIINQEEGLCKPSSSDNKSGRNRSKWGRDESADTVLPRHRRRAGPLSFISTRRRVLIFVVGTDLDMCHFYAIFLQPI